MAKISIKYPIGSRVHSTHKNGIDGIITAIFIRGKGRAYEFSYIDHNGNPTSSNLEEIELEPADQPRAVGFGKWEQST